MQANTTDINAGTPAGAETEAGKEKKVSTKGGNGKGTEAEKKQPLSREDKKLLREQRMARKLELAAKNDTSIVSRTTLDTNTMVYLINWNDRLMARMRELFGHRPNLTIEVVAAMIEKSKDLKHQFDDFNHELAKVVGDKNYESPREFKTKEA